MAATLRQVAELAGVSVRTVSNVVNDYAHVAPDTRARVQLVLDALGYRPNTAARSLRTGRTGLLAVVVPSLDQPYFGEVTHLIVSEATARGYTVVVDQTDGDPQRERDLVAAGQRGAMFDGLILNPLALGEDDLAAAPSDRPLVLLGERGVSPVRDHVHVDNVGAASAAAQHLIDLGRRRIAAIGLQDSIAGQSARQRAQGLLTTLATAGLPAHPSLLRASDKYDRDHGRSEMLSLLDGDVVPDAVFCFSDVMGIGALRACAERGVRVPEDVAVVGFDDIDEARFSTPSLSTVRPDKKAVAHHAVDRLLARIDGDRSPAREIVVGWELVARESTIGR